MEAIIEAAARGMSSHSF